MICLRMVTRCRRRSQKPFYPQFLIGRHRKLTLLKVRVIFDRSDFVQQAKNSTRKEKTHLLRPQLNDYSIKFYIKQKTEVIFQGLGFE